MYINSHLETLYDNQTNNKMASNWHGALTAENTQRDNNNLEATSNTQPKFNAAWPLHACYFSHFMNKLIKNMKSDIFHTYIVATYAQIAQFKTIQV